MCCQLRTLHWLTFILGTRVELTLLKCDALSHIDGHLLLTRWAARFSRQYAAISAHASSIGIISVPSRARRVSQAVSDVDATHSTSTNTCPHPRNLRNCSTPHADTSSTSLSSVWPDFSGISESSKRCGNALRSGTSARNPCADQTMMLLKIGMPYRDQVPSPGTRPTLLPILSPRKDAHR